MIDLLGLMERRLGDIGLGVTVGFTTPVGSAGSSALLQSHIAYVQLLVR